MKKTKLVAAVLATTLVIGTGVVGTGTLVLTPTPAQAADTPQPNNQTDFKWSYNDTDNTATITGMNIWAGQGDNSSTVVIPDTVTNDGKTYKVTEIEGNAFNWQNNMTDIVLPKYLTTIDASAFAYLDHLTNVDFSQATSLQTIGDQAFVGLQQTTPINLPDSVTKIGSLAFAYGHSTEVTLGQNTHEIGMSAFSAMPNLQKVVLNPNLAIIGNGAFAYDKINGTISIPSSVTSIGIQAFNGNLINKVEVQGNPTIGSNAFSQNNIAQITNENASLPTSGATGQTVTKTAQEPTLSVGDLFDISTNGKTNADIDISNLNQGVTYDKSSGKFSIPANVKQFSFDWVLKDAGNIIYSGNYTVFREIPTILADSSTIYVGDTWKPGDNYKGQDLDKLTVTVKDESGTTIPTVDTTKAEKYFVTYSYGNDATTITVIVAKRLATYSLGGSQTVTYNGQIQQPTLSNYSVKLSTGDSYTLQSGDIAIKDNAATPGTYEVYLTKTGIDHLNEQFGNTYELTQGSNSAPFVITDAASGVLNGGSKTYDGKSASSSYTPTFTATDSTKESIGTVTLSNGDYQFESDGSDVGSYKIKLTTAGINAIKAKYPNYTFNDLDKVEATYTITPATGALITLTGGSKTYDGKKVSGSGFEPT